MTATLSSDRRRVVLYVLVMLAMWLVTGALGLFTEQLVDPTWQARTRWSTLPAFVLLSWLIVRVGRLLFVDWCIKVADGLLFSRANMWRDAEAPIDEIVDIAQHRQGAYDFTIVSLANGRRIWINDAFVDSGDERSVADALRVAVRS